MQLVAYGAQDIYLTGNPQITFFKVVYRRHTNFAMESIQQTFNGSADFGNRVTCTVSRNGDLVTNMTLVCNVSGTAAAIPANNANVLTQSWSWCQNLGHAMIDNVRVPICDTKMCT